LSVTGRIRIIAASWPGVVGCSVSRSGRGYADGGPGIHRAAKRRAPSDTGKGHRRHRPADDVDEEGSPAIAAGEVAFQGLNVEGQFIAFKLWRFQHDDSVLHGTVLAEDRDGRVRWVLGKAVVTRAPVRDDIRGELVAGRSYRTIGEDDGMGHHPGQSQRISLQRRAT